MSNSNTAHPEASGPGNYTSLSSNEVVSVLHTLTQVLSRLVDGQNTQDSELRGQAQQPHDDNQLIFAWPPNLADTRPALNSSDHLQTGAPGSLPAPPPRPLLQPFQASNLPPQAPFDHVQAAHHGHTFPPPPIGNTGFRTSLPSLFPDIDEGILLAIARHTFRPVLLFKLDTRIKEKPSTVLVHRERDPSIEDYSAFGSLFNPLVLYFSILQVSVSSSRNLPAIRQAILSCNEYLRNLYDLYMDYEWTSVLNYHFAFHAKRLSEMTRGDYSHWSEIDGALQARFLLGHPLAPANTASGSSSPDISKQVCNPFNFGKCTYPRCKRIHRCKNCQSSDHGKLSCPSKTA